MPSCKTCIPATAARVCVFLPSRAISLASRCDVVPPLLILLSKGCYMCYVTFQEPGTDAEIKETARSTFNLTSDFFSKIDVNGPTAHPLFIYLQNALPGVLVKYDLASSLLVI